MGNLVKYKKKGKSLLEPSEPKEKTIYANFGPGGNWGTVNGRKSVKRRVGMKKGAKAGIRQSPETVNIPASGRLGSQIEHKLSADG